MRSIKIKEQDGMLVLGTAEDDGFAYLHMEDGRADTSLLDENACQKTFACSTKELRRFIRENGY